MKALISLALLCMASCATVPPAHAEGPVGIGQMAYTNGLRIRPLAIVEDSRCPTLVRCVWAGRLVVRSEIVGGRWKEIRNVELGKPQQIADGTLTLVSAEPQKAAPGAIKPSAYRFTFDFQGGL